jgi:hypothetical protein
MEEILKQVTETIGGHHVKNLRWKKTDNLIAGHVKDDLFGNPKYFDGYVTATWYRNGTPLNKNKGRTELTLKMTNTDVQETK